jgi:hypothetical protein
MSRPEAAFSIFARVRVAIAEAFRDDLSGMPPRLAASKVHDPAIGLTFETADIACALDEEIEFPADIVLWHGSGRDEASAARAVARAGRALIADKGVAA